MVDSIGRFLVGRKYTIRRERKNFLQTTIQNMEQWRDKARTNLIQLRERYKLKVESNQALMITKKENRLPNLNPCAITLGNKPKSRKYGITHSTVPSKPKYSTIKPAERIYGKKWKNSKER